MEFKKYLSSLSEKRAEDMRLCDKCFMTGKACLFEHEIDKKLEESLKKKPSTVFLIMSFGSLLDDTLKNKLEERLGNKYELKIERADEIERTGYVICEKICKQIQQSVSVCVDFSYISPNVLYELGLAYSLGRASVLFAAKKRKHSSKQLKIILKLLGYPETNLEAYVPFKRLRDDDNWECFGGTPVRPPKAHGARWVILLGDPTKFKQKHKATLQSVQFSVADMIVDSVESAKEKTKKREEELTKESAEVNSRKFSDLEVVQIRIDGSNYKVSHNNEPVDSSKKQSPKNNDDESRDEKDDCKHRFECVAKEINESDLLFLSASAKQPISYFWLGYAHGLGREVVPIYAVKPGNAKRLGLKERGSKRYRTKYTRTLPFDVSTLWHVLFHWNAPKDLVTQVNGIAAQLSKTYKPVDQGYDEGKKRFFTQFVRKRTLSIFVGATESEGKKRYTVSNWDYVAVSLLRNFFFSEKPTLHTRIRWPSLSPKKEHEINEVHRRLEAAYNDSINVVCVGTGFANAMTEFAFATLHSQEAFTGEPKRDFRGIFAFREPSGEKTDTVRRMFARDYPPTTKGWKDVKRKKHLIDQDQEGWNTSSKESGVSITGFCYADTTDWVPKNEKQNKWFFSNSRIYADEGPIRVRKYYGRIARFRDNKSGADKPERWVLVLEGNSGPATFALAGILTGEFRDDSTIFADNYFSKKIEENNNRRVEMLRHLDSELRKSDRISRFLTNENKKIDIQKKGEVDTYEEKHLKIRAEEVMKTFFKKVYKDDRPSQPKHVDALIAIYIFEKEGTEDSVDERKLAWFTLAEEHVFVEKD